LAHVLANHAYYVERPSEIILPLDGGLSFHGGLVAGLVAVAILSLIGLPKGPGSFKRLLVVAGALIVPVSIGLLGGWLACLLRGCAYGRAVPPPQRFFTPDWPDLFGVHAFRLPSQALGVALALALLLTARLWMRRPGLFLIVLGLGDWAISTTRGDLSLAWGPLLAVQWADLAIIVAGIALEIASCRRVGLRHSTQVSSETSRADTTPGSGTAFD
jgi:prolipoprotein diacylglyceryltransferase